MWHLYSLGHGWVSWLDVDPRIYKAFNVNGMTAEGMVVSHAISSTTRPCHGICSPVQDGESLASP